MLLLLPCTVLLLGCVPLSGQVARLYGFDIFWKDFRKAVAGGRADDVAAISSLPFRVRGHLDDSPVRILDKTAFKEQLPDLLDADSGVEKTPISMRALIRKTESLLPDQAGSARLGNFVFRVVDGRWRFVLAYHEP